jgi:hypothetical protein
MLEAAGGSPRTQKRGQDSPHGPRPVTTTASLGRGPTAGAPHDPRCPWSSGTGLPDHRAAAQAEDFEDRGQNTRKHRENTMIRVYVKFAR